MARTNPATGTKHAADRRAKSAAYRDDVLHPASSGSVVVVGAGMVAHRFVESLTSRDTDGRWSVAVLGDEARGPYDRVGLTGYFSGKTPEDLALDPAVLPGTSSPEPEGLSYGQALRVLAETARRNTVVGLDLVELAPNLDPTGRSELIGARLIMETLAEVFGDH